jgi:hypothetical protein
VPRLPLDPRHGTHEPTTTVPARAPGSVRRTTSIDILRPHGLDAELVLVGRGRDLLTDTDGGAHVLDTAEVEATIDYADAQRVTAITSTPEIPGLEQLVGRSSSTGFRGAIDIAVAGHDVVGRPVYQLLDDLPVATLISGYAPQHAMAQSGTWADERKRTPMHKTSPEGLAMLQQADLCAGWKAGGTIMQGFAENHPPVVTGPDAPSLDDGDDPLAWHEYPGPLPEHAMRRRRRIDVGAVDDGPSSGGLVLAIDAHFRDSYVDDEGETVVHEYTVLARLDAATEVFLEATATPRVLPWFECPEAAASAGRLAGRHLDSLRAGVRAEFLGATTCTHLNDMLRALADVGVLGAGLGRRIATPADRLA